MTNTKTGMHTASASESLRIIGLTCDVAMQIVQPAQSALVALLRTRAEYKAIEIVFNLIASVHKRERSRLRRPDCTSTTRTCTCPHYGCPTPGSAGDFESRPFMKTQSLI